MHEAIEFILAVFLCNFLAGVLIFLGHHVIEGWKEFTDMRWGIAAFVIGLVIFLNLVGVYAATKPGEDSPAITEEVRHEHQ